MADFEKIIPLSLKYEGGDKYTDIAEDAGGATKYGISLVFASSTEDLMLFDKNDDCIITKQDIRLLEEKDAVLAYKKYFWDKLKLDEITSNKKAFAIFDSLINNGPKNATKIAQRACNALGKSLVVDGIWGEKTKNAVQRVPEDEFLEAFLEKRLQFFENIVKNNPSQKIFIRGWKNRIDCNRRDAAMV